MTRLLPALVAGFVLLGGLVQPALAFERAVIDSVVAVLRPEPAQRVEPQAGPEYRPLEPEGSAVALAHGLFVTANHVLGPGDRALLRLDDGRVFEAKVTARAPAADLALLESAAPARPMQWGDTPLVGQEVCAVGNAFGLGISTACGVVSKKNVTHAGFNPVEDFLQTDAATNPGMSGGALVNDKGKLVGILSAIFTKNADANIGVNFAVSAELTQRVVADLKADGKFTRPSIGASLSPQPRLEPRKQSGARVTAVTAEGPAARAGMREGDLLIELAGRAVQRPSDAVAALALAERGSTIEAVVQRDDGPATLEIELPSS
jgi:S1-C subfamily serine protease